MAAPKKKPPVKKSPVKKPPVKKKPSFLRKDTPRPARDVKPGDLRSQTLTNDNKPRPARDLNKGGLRAQYLKSANAGGGSAVARGGSAVARGLIKKIPVVGAALGFIADAAPAGTGSTVPGQAQKAVQKKMKREIRQGPTLAVTGVREGVIGKTRSLRDKTGQNRPEYPTWKNKPKASKKPLENRLMKPAPGTNYSGQGTTSSTTQNRPTTTRPKPLNTLAADYAAKQQGQNQGQAKAKNAAPKPTPKPRPVASSAPVKKVGRLTRTEREGLSTDRMQRKPKGNLLGFLKKRK